MDDWQTGLWPGGPITRSPLVSQTLVVPNESYLAQIFLSFGLLLKNKNMRVEVARWGGIDVLQITIRELQVCYKVLSGWAHPLRHQVKVGDFVLLVGAGRHHLPFFDSKRHLETAHKTTNVYKLSVGWEKSCLCRGKVIMVVRPAWWSFACLCICMQFHFVNWVI